MGLPSCAERRLAAPINKMNRRKVREAQARAFIVVIIYFVSDRAGDEEFFSNACLYSA
jgi:hypothetical protein